MRRWRGRGGAGAALTVGLAALMMAAPAAHGQLPIDIWLRPLVAAPIGDFAATDDGIDAGPSFGFDAGGAVTLGALTVYGEYQEVAFECGECREAGLQEKVLDRGWGAGVLVPLLSPLAGLQPWARLGVIGHHLRFRSDAESGYSSASLGWSAGMGAEARLLGWLRVEPALLFRSYDGRFGFAIDVPDRDVSISYIAVGLGIGIGF